MRSCWQSGARSQRHTATMWTRSQVPGWTIHDLRRTARSLMSQAGVAPDHAERALGHVIGGVRGVYDRHAYRKEKRQAFEALAARIDHILRTADGKLSHLSRECPGMIKPARGPKCRLARLSLIILEHQPMVEIRHKLPAESGYNKSYSGGNLCTRLYIQLCLPGKQRLLDARHNTRGPVAHIALLRGACCTGGE
jgi:hypothetical protein